MKHAIALMLMAATMLASCTQNGKEVPAAQSEQETSCQAQTVTDLMMSRRSIRQYKDQTLDRETLREILKCGINAPNGQNRQAYEVRVIDNPTLLDEMTRVVITKNPKVAERPGFKNIFVNAPCVVFIARDMSYDMAQVDCGLLGENIILAAWEKGIGSCCLGGPVRMLKDTPEAAPYLERLGFSEGYELLYCIALGYPDETPDAKPRKEDKIKFID